MQLNTAGLKALVAAVPPEALRELVLTLLLQSGPAPAVSTPAIATPAPARAHKGWPPGKPRGGRKPAAARDAAAHRIWLDRRNARLAVKRAAAKAEHAKPANGNGAGNGSPKVEGEISPEAIWAHAEKLRPKAPWRVVASEFGLNEASTQDAHRHGRLPPGLGPEAAARFLEMTAG